YQGSAPKPPVVPFRRASVVVPVVSVVVTCRRILSKARENGDSTTDNISVLWTTAASAVLTLPFGVMLYGGAKTESRRGRPKPTIAQRTRIETICFDAFLSCIYRWHRRVTCAAATNRPKPDRLRPIRRPPVEIILLDLNSASPIVRVCTLRIEL